MRGAAGARIAALTLALGVLAACSDKDPRLLNLTTDGTGPDEFMILPGKPLQQPDDYTTLPEPTPGGTNLTDPTPVADAVEALGGDGARATNSPLRAGEGAVVSYAARYGVTPDIRDVLAAEDLQWRRDHNGRLLERLFNVTTYFKAYAPMSLDQYAELERLRALGVWTPQVPPDGSQPR